MANIAKWCTWVTTRVVPALSLSESIALPGRASSVSSPCHGMPAVQRDAATSMFHRTITNLTLIGSPSPVK